jgi:hypothetical protein
VKKELIKVCINRHGKIFGAVWLSMLAIVPTSISAGQMAGSRDISARMITIPPYIKDGHRPTLQEWLNSHPRYRPAVDADCCDSNEVVAYSSAEHSENAENPQFYYADGDFNRDGLEDFAIVLIDTIDPARSVKTGPGDWIAALAVFNGPFYQLKPPAFFKEHVGHPSGSILWYRKGTDLCIAPPGSSCSVLVSNRRGYAWQTAR